MDNCCCRISPKSSRWQLPCRLNIRLQVPPPVFAGDRSGSIPRLEFLRQLASGLRFWFFPFSSSVGISSKNCQQLMAWSAILSPDCPVSSFLLPKNLFRSFSVVPSNKLYRSASATARGVPKCQSILPSSCEGRKDVGRGAVRGNKTGRWQCRVVSISGVGH